MIEHHEVGSVCWLVMLELAACPILKVLQESGDINNGNYEEKWTSGV
jgi:hypothetical protein